MTKHPLFSTCKLSKLSIAMMFALTPVLAAADNLDSIKDDAEDSAPKAHTSKANSNLFTLGTVLVKGTSDTDLVQTSDYFETYIDKETIDLFEAEDVGQALAFTPGVFYDNPIGGAKQRSANRFEPGISVRGYGLRYVPVFVDGIPVYIPYDGYSDLSRFSTADISSIEVAKGYSSVMYGHNTMGGAINIVTMKPRSEFDFSGVVGMGEGGTHQLSANVGTLQEKWYAEASVSERDRRYTKLAENYVGKDAFKNNVDSDKYRYHTKDRRVGLKVGWTPTATDEYVLSYSKQTAKKEPGSVHDSGFVPTNWVWPEWDRETFSFVSNTWLFDDKVYVKPRIYYDRFKNTLLNFKPGETSKYDDKAFGASVEIGTTAIDNHLLKMMLSYKDESHKGIDDGFDKQKNPIHSETKSTQKFYSIALEDNITINEQFEAQLGVIYTKRTADAGELGKNTQHLIGQYPGASSMLAPSIDSTDYQAALFYKPNDTDIFRFAIGKKTRFPSFKELYSNFGDNEKKCPEGSTGCIPGQNYPSIALQNPGLKPESATNIELGYTGMPMTGLSLDAAVFYSQSKNTIARSDDNGDTFPGFITSHNYNISNKVERKGIELGVNYDVNQYLKVGGGYTYLHVKRKDDSALKMTDIPKQFGYAYATVKPLDWLEVTPSVTARSSSYADEKGNSRNAGYAVYNIKFSAKPPQWQGVTFNAGVENVFNKNSAMRNAVYPSAGRYLYMNMRYDFY